MNLQYINNNYRKLYNFLKSQNVIESVRENKAIIGIIKDLPHPDVATNIDIYCVCRQCMMGSLERFLTDSMKKLKFL